MKQNNINNTPAIKYIDGQPFVRVIDLGHMWHTNSSNILAIGKPHHVPEEQLRRIDGRVWCSFTGLRYRMTATKHGSSIAGHIREFLDSQAEKKPTAAKPKPQATDLGTAAPEPDARRMAADARAIAALANKYAYDANTLAKANDKRIGKLEIRMDSVEANIYRLKHEPGRDHEACHQSASATVVSDKNTGRIQELSGKLDRLTDAVHDLQAKATATNGETFAATEKAAQAVSVSHASRNRARNNAHRLTKQAARLDTLEKRAEEQGNDSYRRFDTVMTRLHRVERRQGDNAIELTATKEDIRFVKWSVAVLAIIQTVAGIVRMARRR